MVKRLICIIVSVMAINPLWLIAKAQRYNRIKYVCGNDSFGIACAQIINNDQSNSNYNYLDTCSFNEINEPFLLFGKSISRLDISEYNSVSDCIISDDNRFIMEFYNSSDMLSCLKSLKSDDNILYVQQDEIVSTSDFETGKKHISWGSKELKVDDYVDYLNNSNKKNEIIVAIVDSGVSNIEYLKGLTVPGYDFVDNDIDTSNDTHPQSHGTFLAGIVADCTIGANIKIMPVRVLSSRTGSIINAVNGIYYAVDHGANVINFSIGGVLLDCSALDDALSYAEEKGVSVVVSAGNEKMDIANYCPSHNESAITVGAIDSDLNYAERFSNYGKYLDVVAPGVDIISYDSSGNLETLSGTSMSAAYISACVALLKQGDISRKADELQRLIKECCKDIGEDGWDIYCGYGFPQMDICANNDFLRDNEAIGIKILCPPNQITYRYKWHGDINIDGMKIGIIKHDGTIEIIPNNSDITISSINTDVIGAQDMNVFYKDFTESFTINVEYTWWQWIIRILLFGWIWY